MALQDIDSVNLPVSPTPDYIIPYVNFNMRVVSKKTFKETLATSYSEHGYTSYRTSAISLFDVDYVYLECFRLGFRQRIYENYSNIQKVEIQIKFTKKDFTPIITSNYIDNFGLYIPSQEIRYSPTIDFYENFDLPNLITDWRVNNDNSITFTLDTSVNTLYENKYGDYVDLFFKEIAEVIKPEFGQGTTAGIFYIGSSFNTLIYC